MFEVFMSKALLNGLKHFHLPAYTVYQENVNLTGSPLTLVSQLKICPQIVGVVGVSYVRFNLQIHQILKISSLSSSSVIQISQLTFYCTKGCLKHVKRIVKYLFCLMFGMKPFITVFLSYEIQQKLGNAQRFDMLLPELSK